EVPFAQHVARLDTRRAPVHEVALAGEIAEEDVLGDRQLRHHHRVLEDGRDAAAPGANVVEGRRRLALEADVARVGCLQAGQDRDERRFAGTVPPDEPEAVAGVERGVDPAQRLGVAEALPDSARLDNRRSVLVGLGLTRFVHRRCASAAEALLAGRTARRSVSPARPAADAYGFATPAQTPPWAFPYTFPQSFASVTAVVLIGVATVGTPFPVSVSAVFVTNGATIGSPRLTSPL